jgi:hypothetical protein
MRGSVHLFLTLFCAVLVPTLVCSFIAFASDLPQRIPVAVLVLTWIGLLALTVVFVGLNGYILKRVPLIKLAPSLGLQRVIKVWEALTLIGVLIIIGGTGWVLLNALANSTHASEVAVLVNILFIVVMLIEDWKLLRGLTSLEM